MPRTLIFTNLPERSKPWISRTLSTNRALTSTFARQGIVSPIIADIEPSLSSASTGPSPPLHPAPSAAAPASAIAPRYRARMRASCETALPDTNVELAVRHPANEVDQSSAFARPVRDEAERPRDAGCTEVRNNDGPAASRFGRRE